MSNTSRGRLKVANSTGEQRKNRETPMTGSSNSNELALFSKPPLLITESVDEFESLRSALEQEIRPSGVIERMFVDEFGAIAWEILRLRRCKTAIINLGFRDAMKDLLVRLLDEHGKLIPYERAETLAAKWFTDQKAKEDVSQIFGKFQLDEYAIEAEAIRRSSSDIEALDKMLLLLESRRNRTLRSIADYRNGFAKQLRESSSRLIEGNAVVQLEHRSSQRPV